MDASEYGVMRKCEDSHWWYVSLHEFVMDQLLQSIKGQVNPIVLDAGCGTGGLLERIENQGISACGLEPSPIAFQELNSRPLNALIQGDLLRTPFADASFDTVSSQDVLCVFHQKQVLDALKELVRVLKPGGYLIMNLPAYQWLISDHDKFVGNLSRFERNQMNHQLISMGMEITYSGYRNVMLFPLVVVLRKLKSLLRGEREISSSDVKMPPSVINWVLLNLLRMENRFLHLGIRFPFGLSLVVIARKPV